MYATLVLADEDCRLEDYSVPPGCQVLLGVEATRLTSGLYEKDTAYWNWRGAATLRSVEKSVINL